MTTTTQQPQFFRDGGTLPPGIPSYIVRPADAQLRECIERGDFAYVLAPRQMGKSSLMARTVKELKDHEHHAAVIDLTKIGESGGIDAAAWYRGLLRLVARELKLTLDMKQWWTEREGVTNQQLFYEFFTDVVLPACSGKIAVFIDEIDSTIPLPFSDDFFAGIRALYNARATEPEFNRISFVLLGVATPTELMNDTRRTPFNVGVSIELSDFSIEEAMPLIGGFAGNNDDNATIIERVLYWTGGHPYLTQKVCAQLANEHGNGSPTERIDALVEQLFFAAGARKTDHNLSFVGQRILCSPYRKHLLNLYKKVSAKKKVAHDPRSPVQAEIKLAGLLHVGDDNTLRMRNLIYQRVFNQAWIREAVSMSRIQVVVAVSIPTLLVAIGVLIAWNQLLLPRPYIEALKLAEREDPAARDAYEKLKKIPGKAALANELMAGVWERKALQAEFYEGPFPALLYRLKAMKYNDVPGTRHEVGRIGKPYHALELIVQHPEAVNKVAFSPDGKRIFTACNDYAVRILDATTGKPLTDPIRHGDSISAMVCSPDGKLLATANKDTAQVWDATTGKPVGIPMLHGGWVSAVTFNNDGKLVATSSYDKTARIWDASTGKPVTKPFRQDGSIYTVAFNTDGTLIATAGFDKTARIWNVATGKPVAKPMKHARAVNAVCFSPTGTTIVTAGSDNTAQLWDVATGKPSGKPMQHAGPVSKVMFSPDGKHLASVGEDSTVKIWNGATGTVVSGSLKHQSPVNGFAFSPDSKYIATACNDWTVWLLDVATGMCVAGPIWHEGPVISVTFSSDGKKMATASTDDAIRIWDVAEEKRIGGEELPDDDDEYRQGVFSTNGIKLLTWTNYLFHDNFSATLWDISTGEQVGDPLMHNGIFNGGVFSNDGKKILTWSDDKTSRLWDCATGRQVGQSLTHEGSVSGAAFSRNGTKIITWSDDKTVRLWDAATARQIGPPLEQNGIIKGAEFSRDETKILIWSYDKTARLWDVTTGEQVGSPLTHDGSVSGATFSRNETKILTWSDDKTARLWNVATGRQIGPSFTHGAGEMVSDAVFSRNETKILTWTAGTYSFRIFDATTGKLIFGPVKQNGALRIKALSPDSNFLITATSNQLFRISLDDPVVGAISSRVPHYGSSKHALYTLHPLNPTASRIAVPRGVFNNRLILDTIDFLDPGPYALKDNVDSLLTSWQKRLALRINDNGEIEPLYPVMLMQNGHPDRKRKRHDTK